jgi:predicted nucleic acid-binding protein
MPEKYYLDTCIWRDFYENRLSRTGRQLGESAGRLFEHIIKNKCTLFYSEFIIRELRIDFDEEEIKDMLNMLFICGILKKAEVSEKDYKEAKRIGSERGVPPGDVLHAIISGKNGSVFVSQDAHAQKLNDLAEVKKPEQII